MRRLLFVSSILFIVENIPAQSVAQVIVHPIYHVHSSKRCACLPASATLTIPDGTEMLPALIRMLV